MDPGSAPAFAQTQGNDGGLFISLAVELEYGELNEFARRFAARIAINGLDRALWLPLALNRLYLRAPYDWLGKDDREKLATLNSEGDFSLLEPGEAGQIVRLTHSHLGDALYRAVRKPSNATAYTHDLCNIFQRALQEGKIGLVQQLLRLFSSGHSGMAGERLAIVNRTQLATDCSRIWKEAAVDLGANADMAADMATGWACWAIDEPLIAQQLGADLMHRAIHSLNDATKVWPFCWQRLWDRAIDRTALQSWADHHLHDLQRMWHPGWSFVWEQLHQATVTRGNWKQLGEDWLARCTRRADWYFVWTCLLPAPAEADWANDRILLLGQQRLDEGSDGPDWAYVLEDLLSRAVQHPPTAAALTSVGWRWLGAREDRAEWAHVWQALLAQPGQLPDGVTLADLLGCGWRWLDGRDDRAEWTHVWQTLLAQPGQLPEGATLADLLGCGWRWLADHRNSKEWPVLWWDIAHQRGLLEDQYEALMKMGVDWLTMAGHLEMLETSRFVEGLLEMGYREQRFIDLAVRWLQGSSDERPWPIIAARFVAAAPFNAAAGGLATELMRRIRAYPNNGAWVKITRIIDGPVRTGTALPLPVTALLEALHARSTASVWERARELQQSGATVRGRVVAVKPDFFSVELDIGLLAVLPRQRGNRIAVGEVISAAILKVTPKKGFVELGDPSAPPDSDGALVTVGSVCDGRVNGAKDYGLFIQVGRRSGLLHRSKMPDPVGFRTRYPIGSALRVRVLEISAKGLVLEFAA